MFRFGEKSSKAVESYFRGIVVSAMRMVQFAVKKVYSEGSKYPTQLYHASCLIVGVLYRPSRSRVSAESEQSRCQYGTKPQPVAHAQERAITWVVLGRSPENIDGDFTTDNAIARCVMFSTNKSSHECRILWR